MFPSAYSVALVLSLGLSSMSAQGVVDPRLARLDARTRTVVVAIIDSARAQSLPVEPLIDKALEGAAKRATGPQIISAVRTFKGQMAEARSALGDNSTEREVLGGAQAIRAGIHVQQLEGLRRVRPGVQIATALTVVSDLVTREVPIENALVVVSELMQASASDDQLLQVRSDIETDILSGMPPAIAAAGRAKAMEQTLAASTPPNGAGTPGTLPSPTGSLRGSDGTGLKPPSAVSGARSPAGPPTKPPVSQRKRP